MQPFEISKDPSESSVFGDDLLYQAFFWYSQQFSSKFERNMIGNMRFQGRRTYHKEPLMSAWIPTFRIIKKNISESYNSKEIHLNKGH